MAFVAQRRKTDCGVAALAMLCDVAYEDADNAIPWRRHGVSRGTTTTQLREGGAKLGYSTKSTPHDRLKPISVPDEWISDVDRQVGPEIWGLIPANSLVKVPNSDGRNWHWGVWDGERIIDPGRGTFEPDRKSVV